MKNNQEVSDSVIERLPRYYRYLRELYAGDILRVSSRELANMMGITSSQIRHDFNCFGDFGRQGYGYDVKFLYNRIGEILGVQDDFTCVIIGAGHLGYALASGTIFTRRGVKLLSFFDKDEEKIGSEISGVQVRDINTFNEFCDENKVDIVAFAMPAKEVKKCINLVLKTDIKGIWNFTNSEIDTKGHSLSIQNVHIGDTLMTLCYKIKEGQKIES